ncbi:glycosyltransferase family 4 protein [Deinococcus cellulosilyticus]|uniref:Glycosyl transferase family 1 n=1 Tax=Deinococcus cellulosilyticus (strain DSM 18568 / NBRC 106333 / KACC 11606 / 5516J-15) TaxID=1223518 RepID=A0A511N121_DEIC1|nr:glycosyltransferase family 4 protein [Deinococcus cellulosilyticus]GEM46148.1 glycosyl transferase family 1 [Deinococcus cellulosilyticus NBRC 106333 = KACC 11606]
MNILHLTTEYPPHIWGGMGRSVPRLCAAQARAGHQVTVLVYEYLQNRQQVEIEFRQHCRIVRVPSLDLSLLQAHLDFSGFDIINCHIFFFAPLLQQLGLPFVYTVRSIEALDLKKRGVTPSADHLKNMDMQKQLVEMAAHLVVCSEAERQHVQAYFPDSAPISVVPNGYEVEAGRKMNQRSFARPLKKLLFVGRFTERKGIDILLGAYALLLKERPEVQLTIVGGNSGMNDRLFLSKLIEGVDASLLGRVQYTGWLDDEQRLDEIYRDHDVLVVPSTYEPFGNIVLEGFATGIPVVASNIGGPAEIISHQWTGWLFQNADVQDLKNSLMEVLDCPPRQLEAITRNAQQALLQHYDWKSVATQTLQVYSVLLRTPVLPS